MVGNTVVSVSDCAGSNSTVTVWNLDSITNELSLLWYDFYLLSIFLLSVSFLYTYFAFVCFKIMISGTKRDLA